MSIVPPQTRRAIPAGLGVLTLISVGGLLVSDVSPHLIPAQGHDFLAALPLVLIALACVVHQAARRAPRMEWVKTSILVLAFLSWATNQLCHDHWVAMVFNDMAIAAFVLDMFLVIIGWPPSFAHEADAGGAAKPGHSTAAEEQMKGAAAQRA
jgi:hypothetical protein